MIVDLVHVTYRLEEEETDSITLTTIPIDLESVKVSLKDLSDDQVSFNCNF